MIGLEGGILRGGRSALARTRWPDVSLQTDGGAFFEVFCRAPAQRSCMNENRRPFSGGGIEAGGGLPGFIYALP